MMTGALPHLLCSVVLHNLVDPLPDGRHPSVDPWVVRLATPDAPADNSNLFPSLPRSNLHRSARVSAAGVLPLLSGAHHVVHDAPRGGVAVGVLAGGVVPDLDGDLPELVRLSALLLDAAPAHDSPGTPVVVFITVRQTHGPDVGGGLGDVAIITMADPV